MYSILSDLEYESIYKIDDKYEFLLHYPDEEGDNYNWWRQNLSPEIQTENATQNNTDDHYVLGYENVSVHYTAANWGGLSLNRNEIKSYINGDINRDFWYYAIGSYGVEKKIPGPGHYLRRVALYAKIRSMDMIKCISCKVCRKLFFNSSLLLFVFIVM